MQLYASGIENHPDGTTDLNAIVNGNWDQLNDMFSPSAGLTASQATTTVTSSGAVFDPDDVGASIMFADGTARTISAYLSPTQVTVTVSATVASQSFYLYRTDQLQSTALVRGLTKRVRMQTADDQAFLYWDAATGRMKPLVLHRSLAPTAGSTVTITVNTGAQLVVAGWTAGQDETVNISGTPTAGQRLFLKIACDGTSRQITLGTGFTHPSGSGGLVFKLKASKTVMLMFVSDGASFWEVDGRQARGTVSLWSGTVATIPDDWVLCDGNNGTPDLRDKFVVGAKQDDSGVAKTNVTGGLTQTGGAATHTHALDSGTDLATAAGTLADDTASASSLPPYYALAYVMKL